MTTNFNYILLKMIELQTGKKTAIYIPSGDVIVKNEDSSFSPVSINENGLKILTVSHDWLINLKREDLIFAEDIDPEKQSQNTIKSAFEQIQNKQKTQMNQSKISNKTDEIQTEIIEEKENYLLRNIDFLEVNQVLKEAKSKGLLTSKTQISETEFKQIQLEDRIFDIDIPKTEEEIQIAVYQLTKYIVSLCFAGISSTKNPERIALIKSLYKKSIGDAQKIEIRNLKETITTLSKIVNKNNAANKSRTIGIENEKKRNYKRIKRNRILVLFLSVLFFASLTSAMIKSAFSGPTKLVEQQSQIIKLDSNIIYKSIENYESYKNISVSKWRKQMIYKTLNEKQLNAEEFSVQLDSLIRFAWYK